MIESYIYHQLAQRLADVNEAFRYVQTSNVDTFDLKTFLNFYEYKAGLRRSVDKAYEIVVASLFNVIVDTLEVIVRLSVQNPNANILHDFARFMHDVVGLDQTLTITFPAKMYRAGVANVADRGLDMWANFGTAVQVKHLRLTEELAEDISLSLHADAIVIVCKSADAKVIQSILSQIGLRIRSIITEQDLIDWYKLCQTQYRSSMGIQLLTQLSAEFTQEFPVLREIQPFMQERGYSSDELVENWALL